MKIFRMLAFSTLMFSSVSALAFDWVNVVAHVTLLEADYMPTGIAFQLDQAAGACPAGSWIMYQSTNLDTNKANFAMLMSAELSGKQIRLYGNNTGGMGNGCVATAIHLFPN